MRKSYLPECEISWTGRFLVCGLFAASLFAAPALAQQPAPTQADMVSLRNEVQTLKQQQQLILDRLDDLKRMMRAGPNAPPEIKVPSSLTIQGEQFRGAATAPVVIIEYGDFECPFCRRFQQAVYPQLLDTYIKTGKVRYIYRDMPLPFHEHAMPAAQVANCAGEQGKYWQMYDSLFTDQIAQSSTELDERAKKAGLDTAKLDSCVASARFVPAIQRSAAEAAKMEISGTPTFVIGTAAPDGQMVSVKTTVIGAQPFAAFRSALDPLLTQTKTVNAAPGLPNASRHAGADR